MWLDAHAGCHKVQPGCCLCLSGDHCMLPSKLLPDPALPESVDGKVIA